MISIYFKCGNLYNVTMCRKSKYCTDSRADIGLVKGRKILITNQVSPTLLHSAYYSLLQPPYLPKKGSALSPTITDR